MTRPRERLKEIETFWADTGIIPTREAAISYARNDITWLIARCKRLETVLEDIRVSSCEEYIKNTAWKVLNGDES